MKYKVGDRVKSIGKNDKKNGIIVKFDDSYRPDIPYLVKFKNDDEKRWMDESELTLATPTLKYKVGDKIKSINGDFKGDTGVIIEIDNGSTAIFPYLIKFENYYDQHWKQEKNLELITSNMKYKVGDRVRAIGDLKTGEIGIIKIIQDSYMAHIPYLVLFHSGDEEWMSECKLELTTPTLDDMPKGQPLKKDSDKWTVLHVMQAGLYVLESDETGKTIVVSTKELKVFGFKIVQEDKQSPLQIVTEYIDSQSDGAIPEEVGEALHELNKE